MAYEARADGENWVVVNTETDEVKATHTPPEAQEKAERQVRLLHEVEASPDWEDKE